VTQYQLHTLLIDLDHVEIQFIYSGKYTNARIYYTKEIPVHTTTNKWTAIAVYI